MAVLQVMMIILMMFDHGTSQVNNSSTDTNRPIRLFCGRNTAMSSSSFFSNLNSTIAQLRSQLSNNGVYYARAQNLRNQDSVYGLTQCRNYLSTKQCVVCFDVAVSAVESCSSVNGANVFLDNCFLRYENFDEFYDNPQTTMDVGVAPTGICSNQSSSEPTTFTQTIQGLLSDIQVATPRTSDFYVASTRQISSGNTTIYAIAQCVENTSQTICEECLNTAYNNLYSCLPSTEGRTIDLGCFMRYSETPFFEGNQTTNIIPLLSKANTYNIFVTLHVGDFGVIELDCLTNVTHNNHETSPGSSSKPGMIIGASVGAGIFLLILALSLWYKLLKKPKADEASSDALHESEFQGLKIYRYKDLQSATHDFGDEYRVGKGGYGEVFKAIVDDENIVAVKKLHFVYGKAKQEFNKEVMLINSVRHRNLMRLLGLSSDGPQLLLVLEYMPQGSLDKFLWGVKRGTLNWRQRFDIIFGIARGLAHLHEESHVKIIHRDIKSNNILLDDDFQPKIADFGLARFQTEDQSHVTTRFAGTMGYTAPEYATFGHLSEKVDTYSFGIVVLEIISGRRCNDVNFGHDNDYLLQHAWQMYEKRMHIELIDETLDPKEYEEGDVMKIIEIALQCTQSPATTRPTMSEVVLMLSSAPSLGHIQITRPTVVDHDRRIHVNAKGLWKI